MNPGIAAVAVSITFTAFSGCILILRGVARCLVVKNVGVDDVLAVLAYIFSVLTTITIYKQYQYGLGQDMHQMDYMELTQMLKYMWISILAYGIAMTFLKLSALCQYFRFIFQGTSRVLCWVLLVLCSSYGIAVVFVGIFACQPISFFWERADPNGKCIDLLRYWYTTSTWIIITDIIVVAIPIAAVRNLTMPRAQRRALIIVFALGGCGCVTSVLRMRSLYVAATSTNMSRDNANAALWSAIETNIGIACISLPPLKALIVALFPRLMGDGRRDDLGENLRPAPPSDMSEASPVGSTQSGSVTEKHCPDPWAIP